MAAMIFLACGNSRSYFVIAEDDSQTSVEYRGSPNALLHTEPFSSSGSFSGTNLNASSTAQSATLQHSFVVTIRRNDLLTTERMAQSTNESPNVSSCTKLPHLRSTSWKRASMCSCKALRVSLRVVLAVAASSFFTLAAASTTTATMHSLFVI